MSLHILRNEDTKLINDRHCILIGVYPYNHEKNKEKIYNLNQRFELLSGGNKECTSCYIKRTINGKPEFDKISNRFLSISHSGRFWVCAISDIPIGIDIQFHENCIMKRIADRWFHKNEIEYLDKFGYENFYDIWAAKESYVKFTGNGIDETFSSFFTANQLGKKSYIKINENVCYLLRPIINSEYSVCVCTSDYVSYAYVLLSENF